MRPGCYGLYWEGVEGSDCKKKGGCSALDECLASFASGKLTEYQRKLGKDATPAKLSVLSSVSPEAILLAINFQKNAGIDPLKEEAPDPPDKATPGGKVDPPDAEEPVAEPPPPDPDPPPKEKTKTKTTKKTAAKKKTVAKKEPATKKPAPKKKTTEKKEATKKKAPAKKAAEKKPATKKKTTKKKAATKKKPVNPPKAKSVQSATDLAKTKQETSVPPAWALEGKGPKKWDPKFNPGRFLRERKRSPEIARLLPQMVLERLWKGVVTRTVVCEGYYKYNGNHYPTLYSVMIEITGAKPYPKQVRPDGTRPEGVRYMSPWSAVRFWKLKELMGVKS